MTRFLLLLLTALFLLGGCSAKKYYKPAQDTTTLRYQNELPAAIRTIALDGATLADGSIITMRGLYASLLKPEESLIAQNNDYLIASDREGVTLYNTLGEVKYRIETTAKALSAETNGDMIALLLADNSLALYSLQDQSILFKSKQKPTESIASDVAKPIFFDELLIFPTLDGKVVVVDKRSKKELRDFIVSSKPYFNNIIHLSIQGQLIYAATKYKLIAISPRSVQEFTADINTLLPYAGGIYLSTVDGRVIQLDTALVTVNERKFPFAGLISLSLNPKGLYAVERTGYVIKLQPDLSEYTLYEMLDTIDLPFFASDTTLYYKHRALVLP